MKHVIKCQICGKPRVVTDPEYADIIESNHLKMDDECELKAKKLKLPYPFIVEDEGLMREYINKLRGIELEIK